MAVLVAGSIAVGGDAGVPISGTYNDSGSARSYDCRSNSGSHFPDVKANDSFCRHVNYLWARGVVDGFADGTFRPAVDVTRGQMAKFVVYAYKLTLD
jgi:hypothetical protein